MRRRVIVTCHMVIIFLSRNLDVGKVPCGRGWRTYCVGMTGISGNDETRSVTERAEMPVAALHRPDDVLDAAIAEDLRHLLDNGLRTPRQAAIAALQAARS